MFICSAFRGVGIQSLLKLLCIIIGRGLKNRRVCNEYIDLIITKSGQQKGEIKPTLYARKYLHRMQA